MYTGVHSEEDHTLGCSDRCGGNDPGDEHHSTYVLLPANADPLYGPDGVLCGYSSDPRKPIIPHKPVAYQDPDPWNTPDEFAARVRR